MTTKVLRARLITGLCFAGFGMFAVVWGLLTMAVTVLDALRDGAAAIQTWLFSYVEDNEELSREEPVHERR